MSSRTQTLPLRHGQLHGAKQTKCRPAFKTRTERRSTQCSLPFLWERHSCEESTSRWTVLGVAQVTRNGEAQQHREGWVDSKTVSNDVTSWHVVDVHIFGSSTVASQCSAGFHMFLLDSLSSKIPMLTTRRGGQHRDGRMPDTFTNQQCSARGAGCGAPRKGSSLGCSYSRNRSFSLNIGPDLTARVDEWRTHRPREKRSSAEPVRSDKGNVFTFLAWGKTEQRSTASCASTNSTVLLLLLLTSM